MWSLHIMRLAITILALISAYTLYYLPVLLQAEMQRTRESLQAELRRSTDQLVRETRMVRKDLTKQTGELVKTAQDTIRTIEYETQETAKATRTLFTTYEKIPEVVGAKFEPWTDCRSVSLGGSGGACWQAQFTAALGAARYTAGEAARTSRAISGLAPDLSQSFRRIAENAERSSASTAKLTENLSKTFRPLPRWIQIPLTVANGAAVTALPFIVSR